MQFGIGGKITATYERYGLDAATIVREWNPLRMYVKDLANGSKVLLHTWSEKNGHFVVKDVLKRALGPRADQADQICAEFDS